VGLNGSEAAYSAQQVALQPPGKIFPSDGSPLLFTLYDAFGACFARAHARLLDLFEEADPRSTTEMIDEWERLLGLPDACMQPGQVLTLQARRKRVHQKLVEGGGQSRAFYTALAELLGYEITIVEFGPFICGLSRCGDTIGGADSDRFYWKVKVAGPRVIYFRTGTSQCGDSLGTIDRAVDLECILNEAKPAHSRLVFAYEGA
jgi:uncharacterized protein YmfQ (DUF2313 family)